MVVRMRNFSFDYVMYFVVMVLVVECDEGA